MNWEVNYMEKERIVYIITWGTLIDLSENQRMLSDGLAMLEKHGATKCLLDNRDLTVKVGIGDIYYLPEGYDNLGLDRKYKVAIVLAGATNDEKDFLFYETRAANLGYDHRIFKDLKTALDWLINEDA